MANTAQPQVQFADGRPAPFVQPGEPVIKLNPGIPPLGSPEFRAHLQQWHREHNGVPFKLTEKGQQVVRAK